MGRRLSSILTILKESKGFTLVEAFIAILILTLSTLAVLASVYLGIHQVNDIRENIIASSIMQEEMEELRNTSFGSISSGTFPLPLYNSSGTITVEQYPNFPTAIAISADESVRVVVKAVWYSRLQTTRRHERRLVTIITENGINSM